MLLESEIGTGHPVLLGYTGALAPRHGHGVQRQGLGTQVWPRPTCTYRADGNLLGRVSLYLYTSSSSVTVCIHQL